MFMDNIFLLCAYVIVHTRPTECIISNLWMWQ